MASSGVGRPFASVRWCAHSPPICVDCNRRFARELVLQLGAEDFGPDFPEALGRLLGGGRAREGCAVRVVYSAPEARAEISLGAEWRLSPSDEALARWRTLAHEGNAMVVYE